MGDGLRLALTTFTVLPLRPGRVNRRTAGRAIGYAPLVGAMLALAAATVIYVGRRTFTDGAGALLPATLGVIVLALLTRGLHIDGLADTADGLGSHAPAPKALAIMRSPEIGPLGVATVTLVLLLQAAALAACIISHRGTESLLLAVLTGRLAIVHACRTGIPAARPDGLGALVAGTQRHLVVAAWTVAVAGEAFVYGRFDTDAGTVHGGLRALLALLVGLAVTTLLRRHAVRRFGGVSGDVFGALVEVGQATVLVVMATALPGAG